MKASENATTINSQPPLPSWQASRRVFVEVTKTGHGHGGAGWELGKCLWSPATNRSGADRYRLMREPRVNDLVVHFVEEPSETGAASASWIRGRSWVVKPCIETSKEPVQAGPWSGRESYYRIDLKDYRAFDRPMRLREFMDAYALDVRKELEEGPRHYPFSRRGSGIRTVQGIYLAEMTPHLYELVASALGIESDLQLDGLTVERGEIESHKQYAEERRLAAERVFFARNRALVRDAKKRYGCRCQVCGFDFRQAYGDLGTGYIECHHLTPFSERAEVLRSATTLEDVAVVCANCHRMIHRRRPALGLKELRDQLSCLD